MPLSAVSHADVAPIDLSQFFGGGMRRRLRVFLPGGHTLFVVNGAARKAEVINSSLR